METRCIFGRSSLIALAIGLLLALVLSASAPGATSGRVGHAENIADEAAALPDAADVVSAYLAARRWLNAFELPAMDDPTGRIHISDSSGICVQLRRSGRVIGTGAIAPTSHIESELKLRRALGRAMSQVLGDSAVSRLPDDMRDEVGRSLVLELEVAGPPEPIIARSYRHVARQIEPGLHGVALRRGDRWAMLFPSQLLATNGAGRIATRLATLVEELGVSAGDLESIVRDHNVSVYRFHTSHLVQSAPDQLPREMYRGDRLVALSDVNRDSIVVAMNALAGHILQRSWPERDDAAQSLPDAFNIERPPALLGDYSPVADRHDPLVARPFEQALSAFSLARYAAMLNAEASLAGEAATAAVRILSSLRLPSPTDELPDHHPATQAAALYAIEQLVTLPADVMRTISHDDIDENWQEVLAQWANGLTASLQDELRQVLQPDDDDRTSSRIDAHTMAIMTAALARRGARLDHDQIRSRVRVGLDALWEEIPPVNYVALLPWIGWAERDIARATDGPMAHADRLSALREALHDSQVGFVDDEPLSEHARDLHGGFTLADRRRPDAQSIRPMIWLATAARVTAVNDPGSWPEQERRLLGMMRFLMQLTIRESSVWSLRNPERALGGVRNAAWDSDQPIVAQAMALLAIVEAAKALNAAPDAEADDR